MRTFGVALAAHSKILRRNDRDTDMHRTRAGRTESDEQIHKEAERETTHKHTRTRTVQRENERESTSITEKETEKRESELENLSRVPIEELSATLRYSLL